MKRKFLPLNLQFFAEGDGSSGANDQGQNNTGSQESSGGSGFDYEKLASIISGKQQVTEDTILKNYFKEQGLSQDEVKQAISTFKAEKAKNQPDPAALQLKVQEASLLATQAVLDKEATIVAISLGIDIKTIPYVLKVADLSNAMNDDGKVDSEAVKKAINKVLEDVPGFKKQTESNSGFQIGGSGGNNNASEDALKAAFGL